MQNPEPVEKSTNINAALEAQGAAKAPNEPLDSTNDQSPQSHLHDAKIAPPPADDHPQDAKDAPPPTDQTRALPPPLHHQSHMMPPPPPPPPFLLPPMMMQLPPPHFQLPPYLNHHLPFPPYAYPMIFSSAPSRNNICMDKQPWSTGLFDCFSDPKNCFITTFCPGVTFGQVSEILNEGHTPWWEGAMAYILVEIATLSMGTFLCAWTYRAKMRKKHLLKGNPLRDLIVSFFFTRFSLCQLYRQLDHLGYNVPLGWIANKDKQSHGLGMGNRFQVVPPAVQSGMFRY